MQNKSKEGYLIVEINVTGIWWAFNNMFWEE